MKIKDSLRLAVVDLILLILFSMTVSAIPFAYITNSGSNTVSVIDTAIDTVIATIPVGSDPYGVAVNPDGTRVYVTSVDSNTISVIDTTTNNVTATVPVGSNPVGVAVDPTGTKVYVTNNGDNTVSVIDTATNTVTAMVAVGTYPFGVVVSPDGTKVYITTGNSVSVIDTATNNVTATLAVGDHSRQVAVNPDGTKVYVTVDNSVSVIDITTNTVTAMVAVGTYPWGIAVSPDGTKVYVANLFSEDLSIIDTASNTIMANVSIGSSPHGVAVNPDGAKVYVANSESHSVYVIDTITNSVEYEVLVGSWPIAFGQFIVPAKHTPTPVPPVANFATNVTSGYAPLTVQFTDSSANATSWSWDFGDESNSNEKNPVHIYSTAGNYTVMLTVSNAGGSNTKTLVNLISVRSKPATVELEPEIQWQKSVGVMNDGSARSIGQTSDGGYIVAGSSGTADGGVVGYHGAGDCLVVKLDASGNIAWQKCLGSSTYDEAHCIRQTPDGGYIVAGTSSSNGGDVTGFHGVRDYWIVKLDTNGNIVWQKCLGGSYADEAYSVEQTSDGDYIVAGFTYSRDGDVTGNHGARDYWIVKLDANGNIVWQKCLGGSWNEEAYSIEQTSDGGYIVAGYSISNDGDVTGYHGGYGYDYWVVKLDASGNIVWQRCLGGSSNDDARSIGQTSDGGYIVAGTSSSNDGDVTGFHGERDYWIIKLDANGNTVWQKCLGGSWIDDARSIKQTSDGDYIVAGYSTSTDGDVTGSHGGIDYWVVKLGASGNIVWQECLGDSGDECAYSIEQTSDDGYIVAGTSYWVVKLGTKTQTLPLVANFTSIVTEGHAPLSVQFIDLSENPTRWNWDFDNNGVIDSTEQNPVYEYVVPGVYTVNLTVSNGKVTDSKTAIISVLKTTATIIWSNPTDIVSGTALGSTQLNAVAKDPVSGTTVDGNFTYNPAEGTILAAGTHTLHVDFKPTDTTTYNAVSKYVTINVLTPVQKISQIDTSVQSLVTSGSLNQGEGNALSAKLETITKNLNNGNTQAAINELNPFINQINAYIKSGRLSQAEGQALIDEANSVINALKMN